MEDINTRKIAAWVMEETSRYGLEKRLGRFKSTFFTKGQQVPPHEVIAITMDAGELVCSISGAEFSINNFAWPILKRLLDEIEENYSDDKAFYSLPRDKDSSDTLCTSQNGMTFKISKSGMGLITISCNIGKWDSSFVPNVETFQHNDLRSAH